MRAKLAAALEEAAEQQQQTRLATLRLINAAIRDRLAATGRANAESGEIDEESILNADIMELLDTMVAQREESARAYEEGGRIERAEREREEIAVIREFMPQKLTAAEAQGVVREIIEELGAEGIRDISKVMAELKSRYAGRMDFSEAGCLVRDALCRKSNADCDAS